MEKCARFFSKSEKTVFNAQKLFFEMIFTNRKCKLCIGKFVVVFTIHVQNSQKPKMKHTTKSTTQIYCSWSVFAFNRKQKPQQCTSFVLLYCWARWRTMTTFYSNNDQKKNSSKFSVLIFLNDTSQKYRNEYYQIEYKIVTEKLPLWIYWLYDWAYIVCGDFATH